MDGGMQVYDYIQFMINLHILWCLAHLFLSISSWSYNEDLSRVLASILPPNLTDFSTAYNSHLNQLIIHSGISNGQFSDTTYIFNLKDNSHTQLIQDLSDVRFKACILASQNTLYLFGGKKVDNPEQEDSGEFWELDLVTFKWRIGNSQFERYRFCKMIYHNNQTILIFGASFDGVLDVFTFTPSENQLKNISIVFFGLCQYTATQWDGSSVDMTIPIEDCPQEYSKNIIITYQFQTKSVHYLDLMDSGTTTRHVLQTQDQTYYYQYFPKNTSIVLQHFRGMHKQQGQIISKSIEYTGWNIFCNWNVQLQQFYVTFVQRNLASQLRVTRDTPNFYSDAWPDFKHSLNDFCLILFQHNDKDDETDTAMMVLIHGSLKVYTLHENVLKDEEKMPGMLPRILSSLFGLNQCQPGWTGRNCTVPACPNSLLINGANGISVIRFQCSGHGKCTITGCQCDPLWTGQDCSIYLRSSCNGTLLDNFPLNNCECNNATVGGNDCSHTFCPGDCFGHGKCVDGVCKCAQNFYGEDCSTMVVPFPM